MRKERRTDSFQVCGRTLHNFLPSSASLINLNLLKHNIKYRYALQQLHCSSADQDLQLYCFTPATGLEQPRTRTANIPFLQAYHLAKVAPRALPAVLRPALGSLNLPSSSLLSHLLKLEYEANSVLVRQDVELHSAKRASSQHRCPH
jgi:hypothetical protein